jgi:hypothetical protein
MKFTAELARFNISKLIARDYKPMTIDTLREKAPKFYDGSDIYT